MPTPAQAPAPDPAPDDNDVHGFKKSSELEQLADAIWLKPARDRCPGRWREATRAEQRRGIDYWLLINGRWYSFEVKTENYPLNYFIELYQLVESRRSFELGYLYKCEADFLVLSNLLGIFAVVVPRAEFAQHSIDFALQSAGRNELFLVVNAKKDVVERAAIGIALSYAKSLKTYKGKWALVNFSDSLAPATAFVKKSLWYIEDDKLKTKAADAKMAEGLATYDKLAVKNPNRLVTRHLEIAMERLVPHLGAYPAPAVTHCRDATFAWALNGLVTKQVAFADRFTGAYHTSYQQDEVEVLLRVRASGAYAQPAAAPALVTA